MLAVGTKALPRNGSRVRNIGVLLAVSTLFAARPSAVASQISASANSASTPIGGQPGSRIGGGPETDGNRDAKDDEDADERLDEACQHVAGEHAGTGDGHRAEPVDDAARHVHRDHDRGALDGGGHRHQQDARCDVVEVAGAPGMTAGEPAPEPGAELAAEHIDEQQQKHDRHSDEQQRHRRVAAQAPQVAAQHRRRIGHRVRESTHGTAASSAAGVAGNGEEHVVEIRGMDRQLRNLDAGIIELLEQPAQPGDIAVVGHAQDQLVVFLARGGREHAARPRAGHPGR